MYDPIITDRYLVCQVYLELLNIIVLKIHQIKKLHIELTTKCNARCPLCMRNYLGYDFNSGYPLIELSLSQIKHILPSSFLHQIQYTLINGNLGDFGLARDALEIVNYLVQNDVDVEISTNGSMRSQDWWAQLAHPRVTVGFALDGLEDTHKQYRQDTDWHRIIDNAKAFIAAGGSAVWRFAPFEHNKHQEDECKKLSQSLGFKDFWNIHDGRDQGPVYSRQGQFVRWLGRENPSPPPIKDMLESHLSWGNDHINLSSLKDKINTKISCRSLEGEIYIAADGSVYPCCYMGFYPTQMIHPGNTQLKKIVKENNALEYSLEHCLTWFNQIETTWKLPSIAQGRLYTCVESCGY